MKKIICFLCIAGSVSLISGQAKKEKKFVETHHAISYSHSRIADLQNRYYSEVKNSILQNEKNLTESNLNTLLIFNQKEFYNAVKGDQFRTYVGGQDGKSSDLVYVTNLTSKLDLYKDTVLEKLNSLLSGK
ncbi:hypothetical protein [Chryseobacterium carnipullorum]|nr:hypothetical protein [Chryseobacterium carnipullorum]MDN5478722.1 hypothetical protein [Chryseobacterium sp.]MDN5481398.1 hypothetical protein [Chryseobacterium sp.]STD02783.1 Uncharacterised protein [Chryseobacterium carnipullorum]